MLQTAAQILPLRLLMKPSIFSTIFAATVLLALIIFALSSQFRPQNINDAQCRIDHRNCPILLPDEQTGVVSLSPTPVPVEEPLTVRVELPDNWQVESAFIEGSNMYMGKTPVIFDTPGQGTTFLGACSEPQMHWRLVIRLEHWQQNVTVTRVLDFQTHH